MVRGFTVGARRSGLVRYLYPPARNKNYELYFRHYPERRERRIRRPGHGGRAVSHPGIAAVELDLCNFSAQARGPQMANGFPDPCAEPAAGRSGNRTAPAGGKGMTVTTVTFGGEALAYRHESDRLRVHLPRTFQSGERCEFTVSYHGVPATGILIGNNKYGDRSFFSNPWPHKARNY